MAKEGKDKELDILLANKELKVGDKLVVVKRFSLLDTIRIASHLSSIAGMILNATDATATACRARVAHPPNIYSRANSSTPRQGPDLIRGGMTARASASTTSEETQANLFTGSSSTAADCYMCLTTTSAQKLLDAA